MRIELDPQSREVRCEDCTKTIDAFEYLVLLAAEWKIRDAFGEIDRLQEAAIDARIVANEALSHLRVANLQGVESDDAVIGEHISAAIKLLTKAFAPVTDNVRKGKQE